MKKNKQVTEIDVLLGIRSELNLMNKLLNQILRVQKVRSEMEAAQIKNAQNTMSNITGMFKEEG